MGKRSNFARIERDFYPTPYGAVVPLVRHSRYLGRFHEPCAGDGALIRHLEKNGGECVASGDIITGTDALDIESTPADMFITNPPWDRKILHPLIEHLSSLKPTWLLFDADWMHTKQSAEYMTYCHKIISVGRVKWIPGSKMTGKDNCAWYFFNQNTHHEGTRFIGR